MGGGGAPPAIVITADQAPSHDLCHPFGMDFGFLVAFKWTVSAGGIEPLE